MSAAVQELVAYAAVLLAATWLVVRWRRRRDRPACGTCGSTQRPAPHRRHLPVVE